MANKKLLINFVYYNPLGHLIEALKLAKGFYDANKNLDIYLIINSDTPSEITKSCKWIKKIYKLDLIDAKNHLKKAKTYKKIPKTWDYILDNNSIERDLKSREGHPREKMILNHTKLSKDIFHAKISRGHLYPTTKIPKGLKRIRDAKVNLDLPKSAEKFISKHKNDGLMIGLMIGGSRGSFYSPSIESWKRLITKINKEHPSCKIYLTGVTKATDNSTTSKGYSQEQLHDLIGSFDNIMDCYNIGI